MKNYIKAGFGVTIGVALAELLIGAVANLTRASAEKREAKSEKKSDE